jgi:anti-anti-sigma factor
MRRNATWCCRETLIFNVTIQVALSHLADTDVQRLVIHLGAVSFLDPTGLGALVLIRNAAVEQGKEIMLANIPECVRLLLSITGLDEVFAPNSDCAPSKEPGVQDAVAGSEIADLTTEPRFRIVPA